LISPLELAEPELQGRPFTRKGWIFELKYDGLRPAAIFAFDLLELKGWDTRKLPLVERKVLLQQTLAGSNRIRYVEHVDWACSPRRRKPESRGSWRKARAPYRSGRTGDLDQGENDRRQIPCRRPRQME
jgi:ATP-dependent DNA ligase